MIKKIEIPKIINNIKKNKKVVKNKFIFHLLLSTSLSLGLTASPARAIGGIKIIRGSAKQTDSSAFVKETFSVIDKLNEKIEKHIIAQDNSRYIGFNARTTGNFTVSGLNTDLRDMEVLHIGFEGKGILTINEGGIVRTDSVIIASEENSLGILTVGGASTEPNKAEAPGILNASTVSFGSGKGTLNFNHTDANYLFSPTITGKGDINIFAGKTIFTGTNTFSGKITILSGSLQIGNGGVKGRLGGRIINESELIFNRSDNITYSNITGKGSLIKRGNGNLTLEGKNTYLGMTYVREGTLKIRDTLQNSPIIVDRKGTLDVSGRIKSLSSSGVTMLGDKINKLIVTENVHFDQSHVFKCKVGAQGHGDQIIANGTMTLGGALSIAMLNDTIVIPQTYTLLSSPSKITTQFTSVSINSEELEHEVIYNLYSVLLRVMSKQIDSHNSSTSPFKDDKENSENFVSSYGAGVKVGELAPVLAKGGDDKTTVKKPKIRLSSKRLKEGSHVVGKVLSEVTNLQGATTDSSSASSKVFKGTPEKPILSGKLKAPLSGLDAQAEILPAVLSEQTLIQAESAQEAVVKNPEVILPELESEIPAEVVLPSPTVLVQMVPDQDKVVKSPEIILPELGLELPAKVVSPTAIRQPEENAVKIMSEQEAAISNSVIAIAELSMRNEALVSQTHLTPVKTQLIYNIPIAEMVASIEMSYPKEVFSAHTSDRLMAGKGPMTHSFIDLVNQINTPLQNELSQISGKKTAPIQLKNHADPFPESRQLPQSFKTKIGKASFWIQNDVRNFSHNKVASISDITTLGILANAYATNLGYDYEFNSNLVLGLMTGYSHTNYKFNNGYGEGGINSYRLGLYGIWNPAKNWYVNALIGYGHHFLKEEKKSDTREFNAPQKHFFPHVNAVAEVGYDFKVSDEYTVTPYVSVDSLYFYQQSKSKAVSNHAPFIQNKVGTQLSKMWQLKDTQAYSFIKAGYTYRKALSKSQNIIPNLADNQGNSSILVDNKPRNLLSFGGGSTILFKNNVSISVVYEGEVNKNQQSNKGLVRLGWKF